MQAKRKRTLESCAQSLHDLYLTSPLRILVMLTYRIRGSYGPSLAAMQALLACRELERSKTDSLDEHGLDFYRAD